MQKEFFYIYINWFLLFALISCPYNSEVPHLDELLVKTEDPIIYFF